MNITIIGGDSRIIELIKLLKKENDIFLFGIEKSEELNKENHISEIEEALEKANIIITSIPLSKDGMYINTPLSNEKILVKDFFEKTRNKKIISGNITSQIESVIPKQNNLQIIDILKYEELTVLNSIPTAERSNSNCNGKK